MNRDPAQRNEDVYRRSDVAAGYARQADLYPPEQAILELVAPHLANARMLDLGVGGGRTTVHFAHRVAQYVGADYSDEMVRRCRERFATYPPHVSFAVCDARDMRLFPASAFDFVLFSFNGIDYVSHDDRARIFAEVRRVCVPGGWFAFSSHNLNACGDLFDWRRIVSLDPRHARRTVKRLLLRLVYNAGTSKSMIDAAPYAIINDGAHGRRLRTYYIRPQTQIAQLQSGFSDVRVFSTATGAALAQDATLAAVDEPWLYYLCRVTPETRPA